LYDELFRIMPTPVVALNRAVAVGMAEGPEAGLKNVEEIVSSGSLADYYLLSAVRGDLLDRLGRRDEARGEFMRAAELTRNERERGVLRDRAKRCES
jgi:predicted RNA polymerase sigma factor